MLNFTNKIIIHLNIANIVYNFVKYFVLIQ